MSERGITRGNGTAVPTYVATNSTATSPRIWYGPMAGGVIYVTAVSGATKLTWYAAAGPDEEPLPLYADGSLVETDIAVNRAYPIPDALFGAQWIEAVTNSGTATFRLSIKG